MNRSVLASFCLLLAQLGPGSVALSQQRELTLVPDASLPSYVTRADGISDPGSVSGTDASFDFYRHIVVLEKHSPRQGVQRLRTVLLTDEQTSLSFYAYVQDAIEKTNSHTLVVRNAMCNRRSELTSPTRLAEAMNQVDKDLEAYRETFVRNSKELLGDAAKARLDSYVRKEIAPNIVTHRVDYLRWIVDTNQKIDQVLARTCGQ